MPYTYYFKNKKEYYFDDIKKSSYYLKCIRRGRLCNSICIIFTYIYALFLLLSIC
ncbi:hypothetical protein FOC4_g10007795 [Fusarium odoratissimum]|uniref:Uncharacterized protein n=2 Tax=Fusarium oxysporum species complex TaxID=171631 RepID=N1RNL9_FUSC4|nr:hypothetical protein FOC4_g10007795 [Fusarium odoratissimum]TXC00217.1 hypothetical protein FocTR4_00014514 [Fusarium oxysporum f. sp. cubense]